MARHGDMQILSTRTDGARTIDTEWLARQLRFNFYVNRLAAGDRLPSVRELAKTLRVSPNTVLELYKDLENAGLVETRPRSGTFLRRIGNEDERTVRDLTVFAMMVRLARRLELLGVGPQDFSRMFLRYTGTAQGPSLSFAFISSTERFEMLERQLARRLKWRLPMVLLSPNANAKPTARERLARDPSITCLMSSYLHYELASSLAQEFRLQLIVERLDPATAALFEPPETGTRVIVTRDEEFAANIRHLTRSVYGAERASRIQVLSLESSQSLHACDDAEEIYASPAALEVATVRWGATTKVVPVDVQISNQTLEDLLFHYVFESKGECEG